jgi:two-component system, LytTR family, sensor kinase
MMSNKHTTPTIWQREVVFGVRFGELTAIIGIYFLLFLIYAVTLAFSNVEWEKATFYQVFTKSLPRLSIDYVLKFIFTIPLWYLYFRILRHWHIWQKVWLHCLTLPVYVLGWKWIYYMILDANKIGRLRGPSEVWDIYIPTLIYIVQFGIFHAYQYHLEMRHQKELEAQLRQAQLQSELSAIKAQLNPHFLYNVFNTISATVPPHMENTREMIATLADMFRYQLRASKVDFVPLQDEIRFIEQYLSLEKARFGERLHVITDIEQDILLEKIPPMLLQPLIENAIKHGISNQIEGGETGLMARRRGHTIHFEIYDTGAGIQINEALLNKGTGLKNTIFRLEKMFGTTIHFTSNTPRGTRLWFEIPIT